MEHLERREGAGLYGQSPEAYDRGRLQYPERVYELLAERGVRRGAAVLEIGPATGLVTGRLLDLGATVTAVEPNRALAAALRDRFDRRSLSVVESTFEGADLEHDTFDAVVAGTSFHWVEPEAGHQLAGSVLRPGGSLAYWWMLFEDPWHHDEFDAASHDVLGGSPTVPTVGTLPFQVDADVHTSRLRSAGFGDVQSELIRSRHLLDTDAVVALYATIAVVLRRPHDEQERVLARLAALVDREFGGIVERRFVTAVYSGTKPLPTRRGS